MGPKGAASSAVVAALAIVAYLVGIGLKTSGTSVPVLDRLAVLFTPAPGQMYWGVIAVVVVGVVLLLWGETR